MSTDSYTAIKDSLRYYKGIVKNNKDITYPDGSSLVATAKRKVEELKNKLEDVKQREGRI
jgi:hypothetical protein|tara:strand:- start:420 stop:599 length:180 start_codon:yes stop_codon:yes gene_type:complete